MNEIGIIKNILDVLYAVYKLLLQIKGFGEIIKGVSYITIGVGKLSNWLLSVFNLTLPNWLAGLLLIVTFGIVFWKVTKSIFKFVVVYVIFLFALSLIISFLS